MSGDNNGRWAGSYDWPDDYAAYGVAVADTVKRLRRFAALLWLGGGNELYPRSRNPPPPVWAATVAAVAAYAPGTILLQSTMDGGVLGGNESEHNESFALVAKDGPYDMLLPVAWSKRNPGLGDQCRAARKARALAPRRRRAAATPPRTDAPVCPAGPPSRRRGEIRASQVPGPYHLAPAGDRLVVVPRLRGSVRTLPCARRPRGTAAPERDRAVTGLDHAPLRGGRDV